MARGKSPKRLMSQESSTVVGEFPSEFLAASPVMLLVFFHQAFRGELSELHILAVDLVEGGRPELVAVIRDRFEFLKLAYSYHSAAEDEVIFLALNKNVASRYSLEHRSIDKLFDSFFQTIDALLMDGESNPEACRELLFSIGIIQALICKHMIKEEKQVFPLLMQQFSQEEQASLMWQFMCSVPIMLLEDFLPWIVSFLSPKEREHIVSCVKDIVPQEEPLQEVIRLWLYKNYQPSSSAKRIQKHLPSSSEILGKNREDSTFDLSNSPLDGFTLWHGAIRKDLADTLQELHLIRSSRSFSSLNSVVIHLKFLADVLSFYSNTLDQLFYPLLAEFADRDQLINEYPNRRHIESLQELLHSKSDNNTHTPHQDAIDQLCHELEVRVEGINEFLTFNETRVFDCISKNCNHETQQQLVSLSIRMLPLGLLKCAMTWFLSHLTQYELSCILRVTNDTKAELDSSSSSSVDKPFGTLLYGWFRVAANGKTSPDKFRIDLQEIFKGRICFLSNLKTIDDQDKSSPSSTNLEMPYSSGMNQHVFFPSTQRPAEETKFPFMGSISDTVPESSHQPRPMDIIVYFHKALKKDLERLVEEALHLTENAGFLKDFWKRFRLMKLLYKMHSDYEDDIAFPALEAKEQRVQNISHSYTIDHKLEVQLFDDISALLDKMMELQASSSISSSSSHRQLGVDLQNMCRTAQKLLSDHIDQEDIEIWSLFGECFTLKEQDRIMGSMLGRIRADILQEMIPWLMASLSVEEYQATMSSWRRIARKTMFDEWISECWEEHEQNHDVNKMEKSSSRNELRILEKNQDPMEIISNYLSKDILHEHEEHTVDCNGGSDHDKTNVEDESGKTTVTEGEERSGAGKCCCELGGKSEELEAVIRRVSRDSSLDSKKKSFIIQNLLMSRWIIAQQKSDTSISFPINEEDILGRSPSYRDPLKLAFGCKHYKRNCKLLAECCNKLFTCRRCHEEEITEHNLERKSITKMMCMQCLVIQPIGPVCRTKSCNNLSMGKYYCRICKIFDDEREIYHCPYCNLCRLGKGLGIDYFHCMHCNACMMTSLTDHICREKSFEDNCPICHEYMFTSSSPVKALMCGHLMHSTCFKEYTCTHYTCPICSKSLGDMQVYFQLLDSLLAEERMPEEYLGQTQVILCNDCEKRGNSPFHWLYHKCSHCNSYNTRLL